MTSLSEFIENYIRRLEELEPVKVQLFKETESTSDDDLAFFRVLDDLIISEVKKQSGNMVISDMDRLVNTILQIYPVRESDLRVRINILKGRGWKH